MRSDGPPLRRLAPIRRARGFRLYDVKGRRFLDLYREGALLGHRGDGVLTVMKSVLSQGLAAPLPSIWEQRLLTALERFFPGCGEVRLYSSFDRALGAARCYLGDSGGPGAPHDPALHGEARGVVPAALWRPFLPLVTARAVLPILPTSVGGAPSPVCFFADVPRGVPPSEPVPGFILAGAVRSFQALAAGARTEGFLSNPALERAVDAAEGWARTGPYVRSIVAEPDYPAVHEEFLREGVLLSPVYPGPSVLPGECSPGESRRLADLFTRVPGG
jgi:hypothetical protein